MAGAKSFVVLCFFLLIATSQAAKCKWSVCYRGCRAVNLSKETCSKNCHCSLVTVVPDELGRKVMMAEALATKMEEDSNRAEAALEEEMMMMMMEELSLDEKLAGKCKYQPCYRVCRASGGTKAFCGRQCNCTQLTEALAGSKDMKDAGDGDEVSAAN